MAKKINQLPSDPNLTRNRHLFSGDPATGQLFKVTYNDVRNLVMAPDKFQINVDGTYLILAGNMVQKIMITPVSTSTIKIGTVSGGDDILLETTITGGTDHILKIDVPARVNKTLYFTGVVSNTNIAVYLDKL